MPLLSDRPEYSVLVVGLARMVASMVLLILAYLLLPLDRLGDLPAIISVAVALVLFFGFMAFEIRSILSSTYPGLRALQALGVLVPLLLLIFAAVYYVLALEVPESFTEDLSRLDSLYFTITVFATVGFGDISARTPNARAVVSIQMITNLIVLGVGLRVILGAVRVRRAGEHVGSSGGSRSSDPWTEPT